MDIVWSDRTKPKPGRLLNWMKSVAHVLFIGALSGMLMASTVACPMWTGMHRDMPCSKTQSSAPQCPSAICQASSLYLTAQADRPLSQGMPSEAVSTLVPFPLSNAELIHEGHHAPPGLSSSIFLQTHSLLI